jgi:hypothetical protein
VRIQLSLSILALIGCTSQPPEQAAPRAAGALADLVAAVSCMRTEDSPRLAVAIANVGDVAAVASRTLVEFGSDPATSVMRATGSIAAKGVRSFELDFPAACERLECSWKVTVDAGQEVDEADEGNNSASGRCN